MPVALKLSKKFYDTFGEQVTNELVDAFNQVDATYRSDLREMNESNFARSDAKQEARFAQFEQRWAQFEAKDEARFAGFEQRWAQFEAKNEARFAGFEQRWAQFEAKADSRFAGFEERFSQFETHIVTLLERRFGEQNRFLPLGFATLLAAIAAQFAAIMILR